MHPNAAPRKAIPAPSGSAVIETRVAGARPAFAAVVVANVALAFGPLFVRTADVGPVASAFWRMSLATPVLMVLAWLVGRSGAGGGEGRGLTLRLPRGRWVLLALAGIAFALDLGSWHIGILRTTLANATLFGNSASFILPLYGFVIARAWPTRTQGFALALALAGAMLLMGRSYQMDPRHLAGDLLCVLAGVLYAIYFMLMSDVRRTMAPLPALALSSVTALLPLWALAMLLGERIMPGDWTPLLLLALVSQIVGRGCMIFALGRLSPLVIGLALLIQPMVGGAIGWVLLGERLGLPDLVGAVMVAVALVLVRRTPRLAKPATATDLASTHVSGRERP